MHFGFGRRFRVRSWPLARSAVAPRTASPREREPEAARARRAAVARAGRGARDASEAAAAERRAVARPAWRRRPVARRWGAAVRSAATVHSVAAAGWWQRRARAVRPAALRVAATDPARAACR